MALGTPGETLSESLSGHAAAPVLSVRCWGTRGSVPCPGPSTVRYGGNTPCVEVRVGPRRVIFDAGTGIRLLGGSLMREASVRRATIFLTHFHWDHIQGFPFFAPIYDPGFALRIVGPAQEGPSVEKLIAGQLAPHYFPIPFQALSATLTFENLQDGPWEEEGLRIRAMRMRHPSFTTGYRVEVGERSVVFIPDNELVGSTYPVPAGWGRELEEFVAGADLLLHDAMYTDDEYRAREGWGHSTFTQVLELAQRAGVKRLSFFHHDPERSDDDLDRILDVLRRKVRERGIGVEVEAAAEGRPVDLPMA